jgi:hypothetical protein
MRAGGRCHHAPMLHGSGEVKIFTYIMRHSNSGIKRCRRMRGIKLAPQENARNETRCCRSRRKVKFGALGEGRQ